MMGDKIHKEKAIIIIMITILVLSILVACNKTNKVSSRELYSKANDKTELQVMNKKAFKEAKSLNRDKINPDLPKELYIAMFGFNEFKNARHGMSNLNSDDPRKNITFTDSLGNDYYIYDTYGRIQIKKKPKLNEEIYKEEVKKFGKDNFHLWEEYVTFHMEVYEGITNKDYVVSDFKIRTSTLNEEERLFILFNDDICFDFSLEQPALRHHPADYYWALDNTNTSDDINDNRKNNDKDIINQNPVASNNTNISNTAGLTKGLENRVWVSPEYDGASIEFIKNEIHYGFYRSERELSEKYKIKQIRNNTVELLVNGKDIMIVNIIDQDKKIQVDYLNTVVEYISDKEWEKMIY